MKDTYTKIDNQLVEQKTQAVTRNNKQAITNLYVYKNIWNRTSKGKYDSLLELWTGEWMVNKFIYTYTITMI